MSEASNQPAEAMDGSMIEVTVDQATESANIALGTAMIKAEESLHDGSWKQIIQAALDEFAAGDQNAKWLAFYSCISSNLPRKLHIFFMGGSQQGKSFIQKRVGGQLFPERFMDRSDLSAKAPYYEVRYENNPKYFDGKIVFLDELADRSEDQRNFIKKMTSNESKSLTLSTVDNMALLKIDIDGLPVIQTNSMKSLDDYGNQLANRLFKANVRESIEQGKDVVRFQMDEMKFGKRRNSEAVQQALRVTSYILERGGFEILNPFADSIVLRDFSGPKNRLPMFHSLLSSIAYANWRARPVIEMEPPIVLASLSDNLEAMKIWKTNEMAQTLAIPNYLIDFLDIFRDQDDNGLTKEEMSEQYRLLKGKELGAESCYAYAHILEVRNILNSRRREDSRAYEWLMLDISGMSEICSLDFVFQDSGILDAWISQFLSPGLISNLELGDLNVENLKSKLLDTDMPRSGLSQLKIDQGEVNSNIPSDNCVVGGVVYKQVRQRLRRIDWLEVERMKLGRYPFAPATTAYIKSRRGIVGEATYREESRKLQYLGKVWEQLKKEGKVKTTDPRRIGREDVQEFMAWMNARPNKLDVETKLSYLKYLKGLLKYFRNYTFEEMERSGVRFPTKPKKPIRVISDDDLKAIFLALVDMPGWRGAVARGMVALYLATGVRPSELRTAWFIDLDMARMKLYVRHPKGEGSWASPQWVGIIRPDLMPMIYRYVIEREENVKSRGLEKATPLFPNLYRGKDDFYSANAFNEIKVKIEERSGVKFRLKDFRSTLTSITVEGDLSKLPAMSVQLRHNSPITTKDHYARIKDGAAGEELRNHWKDHLLPLPQNPFIENFSDLLDTRVVDRSGFEPEAS
jgi:integrase/recombinase XerD